MADDGLHPIPQKAQLVEYRTMLVTARDRMAKLVAEGKSEASGSGKTVRRFGGE